MKSALRSLVLILLSMTIATGFGWLYFRNKGLQRPIHPLAHPFFDSNPGPAVVAWRGGSAERPENTFEAFDHAVSLGTNVILWADVQVAKDGSMIVFHDKDVARSTGGKGWVGYMSPDEIAGLDAGFGFQDASGSRPYAGKGLRIPTLREFLARYRTQRVVLNFVEYIPGQAERIFQLVDELGGKGERILFHGDSDGLSRDLRESRAGWLYGVSQAQATRFAMMSSMGLAMAPPLRGDVYIAPLLGRASPKLTDDEIAELKRRKMRIIAGPVDLDEDARFLIARGADAVISAAPSKLKSVLRSGPPAN